MIEEVNTLIQSLDISGEHAEEIINIFFDFYTDSCTYIDFLYENIRTVRNTTENQMMINEIKTLDDICLFEGDDYILITNYKSVIDSGIMEDCLSNPF